MPNKLKQAWQGGRATVNGWLAIPDAFSAEVMAQAGWDSITVDLQHGVQDYLSMIACFQGLQAHDVLRMVRVPWLEPGIVGKVLDGGAYGVICPMINTREQAEQLVSYSKYPPKGARSNGPIRAGVYGVTTDYQGTANDEILVIPMIETQQAIDDLDAILDVPGIDAVYIGPSDLGFSMGMKPVLDREEPKILDIYKKVLDATKKRGIFAGLHNGSAAYAARMVEMGFNFVTIGNDSSLMLQAAKAAVKGVRDGAKAARA